MTNQSRNVLLIIFVITVMFCWSIYSLLVLTPQNQRAAYQSSINNLNETNDQQQKETTKAESLPITESNPILTLLPESMPVKLIEIPDNTKITLKLSELEAHLKSYAFNIAQIKSNSGDIVEDTGQLPQTNYGERLYTFVGKKNGKPFKHHVIVKLSDDIGYAALFNAVEDLKTELKK